MTRPSPVLAARIALRACLLADAELGQALGGDRVYDAAPRSLDPPYVIFGDVEAEAWGAGDVAGCRQLASLVVWSAQATDAEVLALISILQRLLDGADLALDGHRLVLLRVTGQDLVRPPATDPAAALRRAVLKLEIITEPA